jgi:hypothetical protein
MFLAFIIHVLIWHILSVPCDPVHNPDHVVGLSPTTVYYQLYSIWFAIPAYLYGALGFGICGGMFAVVGIAVAVYIPDSLLTITVPVIIYHFWFYDLPFWLFGIMTSGPSDLYNDGQTWAMALRSLITYTAFLFCTVIIYHIGLRRRLRNA